MIFLNIQDKWKEKSILLIKREIKPLLPNHERKQHIAWIVYSLIEK